ncbi:ABC transporter ATP-binding protein [Marinitenerispora sediminis]|uniref:Peptide ABC transporter ATP-binding protein n=1 Tax=Marinitenerispora sediminis TaxID=1931232 RepID=A0A368T9U2_9ACTN|nr:ABC transporter ATP-binding protein [Marinitenerispora sediminis]RCV54599.1 peptide ABC transporter ATP-binding protein [Marinitenerispora sediminis]RCV59846.1 peptide ABC transporter ATP-binding protein [Marinitenerispora sediminis]RCV61173.1 peptide ABC transporter ATP-binding protein [Marinitenerispora sediminis]
MTSTDRAAGPPRSGAPGGAAEPVLRVEDLRVGFRTSRGAITPVDGVSLELRRGETLGLVGESGCGKSVTSLSIMRLLPRDTARVTGGCISFGGQDLAELSERRMRAIRGNRIAMIFQEPMTSLNPAFTIGDQLAEPLRRHLGMSRAQARARAVDALGQVGISRPARLVGQYPHELSGGMRQRVMIAMAMACEPEVLIADEPTTALDVTIQAQILELIRDLQEATGTAVLLITHDLGVVAETCDRVAVMYSGQIVEQADVGRLFAEPRHPYTRGLLRSLPAMNAGADRLALIPGSVPPPDDLPPGCRFAPRCDRRFAGCDHTRVPLVPTGEDHDTRCLLYPEAS